MNRQRKSYRGLPVRVYVKNGEYKFLAPQKIRDSADNKMKFWITLANAAEVEAAMLSALSTLKSDKLGIEGTMVRLCAEYKANKLGKYTKQTPEQYAQYPDVIANDFEVFSVAQVTTKTCADFLRNNFADKPNTACKYGALMSKLFRFAISMLGLREDNPMNQIDLGESRSDGARFWSRTARSRQSALPASLAPTAGQPRAGTCSRALST